jgi:predicted nucleotide-binding protein
VTVKTALREVNNAVLDLQSADYNTFERPLARLASALNADDLKPLTDHLKSTVDFDAFLGAANAGGSMMGSAKLNWPSDRQQELGLTIQLIERAAENPNWFLKFAHQYYYSGRKIVGDIRKITSSVIIPFTRDFAFYAESQMPSPPAAMAEPTDRNRVFIVHGHDEAPRETVARFIGSIGLEPIILHEQANRGMTIPEKLIAAANVGFAVVLLTPDDVGRAKDETQHKPRARQNVILELGYFMGRLGRERVCALLKGDVEIPSDYMGVVYIRFDEGGGWRQDLARELKSAGYEIDWNKIMK